MENAIHRDIKPTNILLDNHSKAYISDLGIVIQFSSQASAAQPISTYAGTKQWMSPEMVSRRACILTSRKMAYYHI